MSPLRELSTTKLFFLSFAFWIISSIVIAFAGLIGFLGIRLTDAIGFYPALGAAFTALVFLLLALVQREAKFLRVVFAYVLVGGLIYVSSWMVELHLVSQTPKTVSTAKFCGRVNDLKMISRFSGNALSTGVDPRFVVNIEIEKRIGENTPIKYSSGKSLNFAIHSPSRLFLVSSENVKDKRYIFTYRSGNDRGSPAFSLKVKPVKECP